MVYIYIIDMYTFQDFFRFCSFQKQPILGTPPKFNMEPENDGFQREYPFPWADFQVPCWFSVVYQLIQRVTKNFHFWCIGHFSDWKYLCNLGGGVYLTTQDWQMKV